MKDTKWHIYAGNPRHLAFGVYTNAETHCGLSGNRVSATMRASFPLHTYCVKCLKSFFGRDYERRMGKYLKFPFTLLEKRRFAFEDVEDDVEEFYDQLVRICKRKSLPPPMEFHELITGRFHRYTSLSVKEKIRMAKLCKVSPELLLPYHLRREK